MRAQLVLVTAAGCGHGHAVTCDLDRDTIAAWMVTAKWGERGDPASAPGQNWNEELGRVVFMLDNPGVTEWCATRDPSVDNACWTLAGDLRPECLTAREDFEAVTLGGSLCAHELRTFAVDWFVADDGVKVAIRDEIVFQTYLASARAYAPRVDGLTTDRICTEIGGMPLRCYRDAGETRCTEIRDYVRGLLPDDGGEGRGTRTE